VETKKVYNSSGQNLYVGAVYFEAFKVAEFPIEVAQQLIAEGFKDASDSKDTTAVKGKKSKNTVSNEEIEK